MPIVFMLLGLLGYLILIACLKKPICLDEVRLLVPREKMEVSSGNRTHCEIYGYLLHCEYSYIPKEGDHLRFDIAYRKGALTAAFQNGKLLWWKDEEATYKPDDDQDPGHKNARWHWENILGMIQNVVATAKPKDKVGAQTV